jgi:hypothetical protein
VANGNGCIVVDREAWKHLTPEDRDFMIYDTLNALNGRLRALERWAWLKAASQFMAAMIGGGITLAVLVHYGVKI